MASDGTDWNPSAETYQDYIGRTWKPNLGAPTPQEAAAGVGPGQPIPPAMNIYQDPSYLAFKNALGLEQSTAEGNTAQQVADANRGLANQLPQIAQQGEYSRQDINGGMEARGLYRSGETLDRLGRERQAEGAQVSGLQDATQSRIAALQQALAQQETGFTTRDVQEKQAAAERLQSQAAQQQIADALLKAAQQPVNLNINGGLGAAGFDASAFGTAGANYTPPPGEISGIVSRTAQSLGLDPRIALASMQVESGGNARAVGDGGTSFGLFQLHRGGELGSMSPDQAYDPATNARTALAVMAQVAHQHPGWSPGQIAAAAQRPADQAGYAAKVDAIYRQLAGRGQVM